MKNTFTGTVLTFCNVGIHLLCAEIMTIRKQLILRPEFRSQSGWTDALNLYITTGLETLCRTVKRITYSPGATDPADLRAKRLAEARDTSKGLKDAFDGKSINSDDIMMPASIDKPLPYDLSGTSPDIPQPTPELIPNDIGRMMIIGVDHLFVMATQLDDRTQPSTINAFAAAQLLAKLNELYTLAVLNGGDANRTDIPTGLLSSQKPQTFNANGQYDPGAQPAK